MGMHFINTLWRKVSCPLRAGGATLRGSGGAVPVSQGLVYERGEDRQADWGAVCSDALAVLIWGEEGAKPKEKLWIYQPLYVPTLSCGREL